jgi:hypothetical protein
MRRAASGLVAVLLGILVTVALPPPPASARSGIVGSWFSGTVPAGASQSWWWNNANPLDTVYEVGLRPVGAPIGGSCQFEVTRSWYVQQPDGEREFHFVIRNVGTVACDTEILLTIIGSSRSWSTGSLAPGSSRSWTWNNTIRDAAYRVGLSPTGAASTSPCQLEVTRTFYRQQPGGEREFVLTVKNVGTVACAADVLLGRVGASATGPALAVNAGQTRTDALVDPATPVLVFVPGLAPAGATDTGACQIQAVRHWYEQHVSTNGATSRILRISFRNIGSLNCSARAQFAFVA